MILEVRDIVKQYAGHRALNRVSLSVPKGCIYGLLGPNGAGKTSLIRIITQITAADEGEVKFNGEHLKPDHIRQMGYLPEERGLYRKMEVGEQLIYFARLKGLSRQEALKRIHYWVEKFDIGSWWKKRVEELSKGMQQKVQFIATILHEPDLIILDEPFSGFDPINANLITEEILSLKERGASVIFSTHRMESVEQLCDYIALINRSAVVLEGKVNEVRNRYKTDKYKLRYRGEIFQADGMWVETTNHHEGTHEAVVRLVHGTSPNKLLTQALGRVEVLGFEEIVPDMQEIFIRAVSGN